MLARITSSLLSRYPSLSLHSCQSITLSSRAAMATGGYENESTLETLKFFNSALKNLPLDNVKENYVRTVQGACFSKVHPTPVKNPKLVGHSLSALSLLNLSQTEVAREDFLQYFSGSKILPGSEPAAHCYCGHQFGYFSGQLGDGCAILLGEVETPGGERWELQLKGSGKTPYSRTADGRKVLRSSIREFLCSEAMHSLGIPTTRAGSCITSDDYVDRDIFYNGNVIRERATVISRIAPSFIRFGSFEIFKPRDQETGRAGPSVGLKDILQQLVDYVIENFYPEIHAAHRGDAHRGDGGSKIAAFFHEVCRRTARLVSLWQCVGFCHGVLNTDNMSILGITIDYGPFGFLDRYNPGNICNGSDDGCRYAYDRQPSICRWNLTKLAEALEPSGLTEEMKQEGLKLYDSEFDAAYLNKMRLKLGLLCKQLPEDIVLVESLLKVMHNTGCDFTNGFRCLSSFTTEPETIKEETVRKLLDQCATPEELLNSSKPKIRLDQLEMLSTQPPQLLTALGLSMDMIQNEMQKHQEMDKLKNLPVNKKQEEDKVAWLSWLASYRERLKLEVADGKCDEERLKVMNNNNPRFVLRNHIAQKAVEMAENGDYSEVYKVLRMLESPYSTLDPDIEISKEQNPSEGVSEALIPGNEDRLEAYYSSKPPLQSLGLRVT